jgi:predicted nuclease of predicted toxin-antitoxin system
VRFLADESLDFNVARALISHGHEVESLARGLKGSRDPEVAEMARAEGRILLTEDRDFGRLVFLQRQATSGVVYLRYARQTRAQVATELLALIDEQADVLLHSFVVIEPGRVRITRLPSV